MERSGITPVVAIVLLLMMTVAASGGAYAWLTQIQDEAQEEASGGIVGLEAKAVSCTRYGHVEAAIRNGGSQDVVASTADVFVYGPDDTLVSERLDVDVSGAGFLAAGGFDRVNATIGTNFSYGFYSNRNQPHTIRIHAPYDDATVSYYIDTTQDVGAANQTVQVPQGGIRTITANWEGDHRLYSTEPVIVAKQSSGDYIYVPPMHDEVLHTRSRDRRSSVSGATIEDHDPFFNSTDPFSSTQIGDGCGGDSDLGMPVSMVTDQYIIPEEVDDYAIGAVTPTTVTVKEWTGSGFTTYDTHDFTGASRAGPGVVRVGDQSGPCESYLNVSAPVLVEGTGEFYLRTNDQSDNEYPVIGYGSGNYREAIALFSGTVNYATIADDTTISINGSTVVTEPTPATGTFSVSPGDRITFSDPVGMEMNPGYPVPPRMTARRLLDGAARYTVEIDIGDTTVTGSCRPVTAE